MRITFLLFALALTSFGLGCAEIDQTVDCSDVCNRYQSCYDASYDTMACRNRCETFVDANAGNSRAANDCDTCMDDRSCVSAVFTCGGACAGILP